MLLLPLRRYATATDGNGTGVVIVEYAYCCAVICQRGTRTGRNGTAVDIESPVTHINITLIVAGRGCSYCQLSGVILLSVNSKTRVAADDKSNR